MWIPIRTRSAAASGHSVPGQSPLALDRRQHRVSCAAEGDEERVPLRIDDAATVAPEHVLEQALMLTKDVVVAAAKLLEQGRRPLDVGEEERDCAAW